MRFIKNKQLFTFLMSFILLTATFENQGYAAIPIYEVPPSNVKIPNQKNFTGWKQILDKGQILYEGYLLDGKFHGQGTLYDNGVIVYSGNWSNGKYDGYGIAYYGDGNKWYDGEFKNGLLNGYGIYFNSNGNKSYEGNLKEGYREGFGTTYSTEGIIVESKEYIDWTIVFMGDPEVSPGRWGVNTNFSVIFFEGMIGDTIINPTYFDTNGNLVLQPAIKIDSNKNYNIFIQGTNLSSEKYNINLDISRVKVKVSNRSLQSVTNTATLIDNDVPGTFTKNFQLILDMSDTSTNYNDIEQIARIKDVTDFSTTITISYTSL
ncbi:hypothetical protein ACFW35_02965 [Fictibacillus sp. NPDC058756]|uniref:hypothetical protein n=1 Tax=Fictibacillus sp. NPDC058756 TaxID=3346625 RepID=UPI0036AE7F14